ncbi:hypothetical protein GYB43_11840 [bacterium]|nr:hypothetical protein [bacterium]
MCAGHRGISERQGWSPLSHSQKRNAWKRITNH